LSSYSILERIIARSLENFPFLKRGAKSIYQRLNFFYFREPRFQWEVHPKTKLFTPEEWANVKNVKKVEGELFFGYYDKTPWSQDTSRMLLHRKKQGHTLELLVFDRQKQDVYAVGTSRTWNYQQGTMAQWLPGSKGRLIIYNDLFKGQLVSRIVTLDGKEESTIPWPVQTVHPGGLKALSLNYIRLARLRPEYGYAVKAGNFDAGQPLHRDGIWEVDLTTGKGELVITLAELYAYQPRPGMKNSDHKINHILYSRQGSRFAFMHRWIGPRGKFSRLYCADSRGKGLNLLLDDRMISHYHWYDEGHLLVYARTADSGDHYYLINVETGEREVVDPGVLDAFGDGHPSFSPGGRWIATDSYPDRARQQRLVLYNLQEQRMITCGRFLSPLKYNGIYRCDLHPRWSPDGCWISFDSTHTGERRSYLLDVSAL